jgi:hypothetical protein
MPTTFFKTIYRTNATGKPIIHDTPIRDSIALLAMISTSQAAFFPNV